jgi:hypothetical protein
VLSRWIFVFGRCLLPAPFPRMIIGGVMRLISGCWSSIVCRRIANRSFNSLRAAIAKGRGRKLVSACRAHSEVAW